MAIALTNEERFVVSCEGEGEAGVRHKLVAGRYSGRRAVWASEWLDLVESGKSDAIRAEEAKSGLVKLKESHRFSLAPAGMIFILLGVGVLSLVVTR